jgi:hypothetical protein
MVDAYEKGYQRVIRSPRTQGPEALLDAVLRGRRGSAR